MIKLGKLILPTRITLNNDTDELTLYLPEYMTQSYIDDSECSLHFNFTNSTIIVDYYCEDDYFLSDKLDLDSFASGDLKQESFEAIQERALKKLCEYIDDDQREMLEHFKDL